MPDKPHSRKDQELGGKPPPTVRGISDIRCAAGRRGLAPELLLSPTQISQTPRNGPSEGRVEALRSWVRGRSRASAEGPGTARQRVPAGAVPERGNPKRSVGPDAGTWVLVTFAAKVTRRKGGRGQAQQRKCRIIPQSNGSKDRGQAPSLVRGISDIRCAAGRRGPGGAPLAPDLLTST